MITYSFYESDNRVLRYAEALAHRGDDVHVLAVRRRPDMPLEELVNGVHVHRVQDRFGKTERTKLGFLWPLLRFLVTCASRVRREHRKAPFDLLHVHNIPDFLVFAARPARARGAKVILDIHDLVPEFFGSKFATGGRSFLVSCLEIAERASAAMADHVILANPLWVDRYAARSARAEKCSVFINYVDADVFRTRPIAPAGRAPVILFPGGLQWHQGVDIAIRAFATVRDAIPGAQFHIYGDGAMKAELVALAGELGLGESVRFFEPLGLREIAAVMAQCDLAVVPKRADSFGNEAFSTKILEFMAVGVPLVISATKIDRYYFDDSVVRFFESGNADDLAQKMLEVLNDAELRTRMVRESSRFVAQHSWQRHRASYLDLVDALVSGAAVPRAAVGGAS